MYCTEISSRFWLLLCRSSFSNLIRAARSWRGSGGPGGGAGAPGVAGADDWPGAGEGVGAGDDAGGDVAGAEGDVDSVDGTAGGVGSSGYGRGCGAGLAGAGAGGGLGGTGAAPGGAAGAPGAPGGCGAPGGAPGAPGAPSGFLLTASTGIGWPITGRTNNRAVWPRLRASLPSLPGTVMTRLSPSITTSDPETPRPLTRELMICRAWSSASRVGFEPSGVRAVRVTRVPPCRSIPSLGLASLLPVRNTSR